MFANMTDPSKLGPFMATALLATLYGALVANIFCLPIADKLHLKLVDEEINRTLIIDGILMIRDSKSPTLGARNAAGLSAREASPCRGGEPSRRRRERRPRRNAHGQEKQEAATRGGHGWFVTFADLMGLMMSFFVMLVAFSTQDQAKLQIVAGSMRDAFGVQDRVRYSGIIEVARLADAAEAQKRRPDFAGRSFRHADARRKGPQQHRGAQLDTDRKFALAAASLRQALQDMPEICRIVQAHHDRGDQAGPQHRDRRSERPLDVSGRLEGALRAHAPHHPAPRRAAQGHAVSASRSPATRRRPSCRRSPAMGRGSFPPTGPTRSASISRTRACRRAHFFMVAGKADTQPLFPDDPYIAANRRVTITLMREEPPIPPDFKP